jgi:hypothetical protein
VRGIIAGSSTEGARRERREKKNKTKKIDSIP